MSVQPRLRSIEHRASERAGPKHGESCACSYVETVDGEEPAGETTRVVASNLLCFERNLGGRPHVGFDTIIIEPCSAINDGSSLFREEFQLGH